MAAGQRRRRERERRARAAAAGGARAAGAQAAQAAQQLSEDLAREKAVIELSRLRQVVFGWMSEFQAQHGRQPSVQETQERNPGAGASQRAAATPGGGACNAWGRWVCVQEGGGGTASPSSALHWAGQGSRWQGVAPADLLVLDSLHTALQSCCKGGAGRARLAVHRPLAGSKEGLGF